ncbi:hypothetical protein MN116_009024 [Schistosoma mekongi]|uniref:Uncharacterized protein n=1 Tax=Schistosoma mekongi TaxID=38744 RepID=A0AAE2D115_SCHME|nr:hypothetical protein MN116_009024 [Schistosoma mekongi]
MGSTAVGRRHCDNSTSGCTLKPSSSNSAFKCYFFGPNGDQKLPISKFLQFHSELQEEIMRLETLVYSPSSWPWHLLAYTDFPVFVRAITSDINRLWNLLSDKIRKHSSLIEIISCDLAFGLTTCDLTCCEAEIELVQCGNIPIQTDHSVKFLNPSTSTHTDEKDNAISTHKCLHTSHMLVPLFCDQNQLSISNEMNIVLFPLYGIHPDLLQDNWLCISTYTAIYLLLVNNNYKPEKTVNQDITVSSGNMNHIQNARMTYDCVNNIHSDANDDLHNAPIILALLVQISPSHQFTCPITVQHKFSPFSMPSDSKLFNGQQFTVLLAVVDLLVSKNDSEEFQLHGVIHQRLHHLPNFKFELALHNQN